MASVNVGEVGVDLAKSGQQQRVTVLGEGVAFKYHPASLRKALYHEPASPRDRKSMPLSLWIPGAFSALVVSKGNLPGQFDQVRMGAR